MPFTASHPAAVLPLPRWGLPRSALVIGSIVPDLPYYLPTPVDGAATHSLAGVFGADLVLGLVALGAWHALLAPLAVATRPAATRAVTVASWTLIALATATGALFATADAADHRDAAFLAITRGGGAGLVTAALCATLILPARIRGDRDRSRS